MIKHMNTQNSKGLQSGFTFTGRWNQNAYTVIKPLGCGASGDVYLCFSNTLNRPAALKISPNLSSIYREHRALTVLSTTGLTPLFYEADDIVYNRETLHFLSMEYIMGKTLKSVLKETKINARQGIALGTLLAYALSQIHRKGYIYCDLKPENIILDKNRKRLVMIDFGGVTSPGNPVKEFTPAYDRASWGLGGREADEAYDIFALSVLLLEAVTGKSLQPFAGRRLIELLEQSTSLSVSFKDVLRQGIIGRHNNMDEFRKQLADIKFEKKLLPGAIQDKWLNWASAASFAITIVLFLLAFLSY